MESELHSFIKDSLAKGLAKDKIREVLLQANWQPDEVDAALNHYADVSFPVAVPKRKPYLSAREAFMYLLTFLTLYISAFQFGSLIFYFINRAFPDLLSGAPYYDNAAGVGAIRWQLASIIIAFPLYLWISSLLARRAGQTKESRVRKWLTYLTLFVAAGIIIGDLIALISNLLGGELTPRFALKVLTVGAIAGAIFGYYLTDLRKEEKEDVKK